MDPPSSLQPTPRTTNPSICPTTSATSSPPTLTLDERRLLLALTRQHLVASLAGHSQPEPDPSAWPPIAACPAACFVTLTVDGELRGCLGNLTPRLPLHQALCQHAFQAACQDRRFEPVQLAELDRLEIEISILGPLHPVPCRPPEEILRRLRPHLDGVLLRVGSRAATYLPQVWSKLPRPEDFLESLSRKAGLDPNAWRQPNAELSTYQALVFSESHEESSSTPASSS